MTVRSDRLALMELFLLIMQTRNISVAANRLFISPATASRHLKDLESQLGVSLFNRNTHQVIPTHEAISLLPHAEKIVTTWKGMTNP